MAILFKKVKRTLIPNSKESEVRVFPVITYKYGTPATLSEFARKIADNSGVSEGEAISVLTDFRSLLRRMLLEGRLVNIDGLGVFYLSLRGQGCPEDEEFDIHSITGIRVCFRANKDIRLNVASYGRAEGLNFKDVDCICQWEEELYGMKNPTVEAPSEE